MEHTVEQQEIITAVGTDGIDIIKIKAFVGTGKSSTLKGIAEHYTNMKFLYLVFNKSMQLAAEKKFPDNVDIKTVHGFAFTYVRNDLNLFKNPPVNFIDIKDLQKFLSIHDYKQTFCIKNLFLAYCYSAYMEISKDTVSKLLLEDELLKLDCLEAGIRYETVHLYLKQMWNGINKGTLPMLHDFYLKFFQLNLDTYKPFIEYDGVFLDESHDSNLVTLSIFLSLNGKKVSVADNYQKIYGFRKAVNVHDIIEADKELYLTYTFRFGDDIAEKANHILNVMLGEPKKIKSFFGNREIPDKKRVSTCHITRTNVGLIKELNTLMERDSEQIIKTIRKPEDIFSMPLSVLYFLTDRTKYKDKIPEKRLLRFKSSYELKEYAQEINDIEIILSMKLAEDYGFGLEKLLEFAKKSHRKSKNIDIYLSTAHSCKGLEFDKTIICDDFTDLMALLANNKIRSIEDFIQLIRTDSDSIKRVIEEFNLFYVAITRGIYKTIINSCNSRYLDMPREELNVLIRDLQPPSRSFESSSYKPTVIRRKK